jgi:threonine dehydrogenase-like Zn-dependent dehydrogenase
MTGMRRYELVGRRLVRLVEDAPIPLPGPLDVQIAVRSCTVCNRSDLIYYHYLGLREHCSTGIFGHEVAGIVTAVGPGVICTSVGQRVFLRTPLTSGFADYVTAREVCVGQLPAAMPFEQGSILQLLPLAVHATRGVTLGDRVLIVGQGPVGLMTLQVVRLRGVVSVEVADLDDWRLEVSTRLGADRVSRGTDAVEPSRDLRGPFDVAIDAVGTAATAHACMALVRPGGLVVLLGTHHVDTQVSVDLVDWERRGLRLLLPAVTDYFVRRWSMSVAHRFAHAGRIQVAPLLTQTYPLNRLQEALDRLGDSSLLLPQGQARRDGPPREVLKIAIMPMTS